MATLNKHYDDDRCLYPNCNKPRYMESNGFVHEFCGRTHASLYRSPLRSLTKHQPVNQPSTQSSPERHCYSLPASFGSHSSSKYSSSLSRTLGQPLKAIHGRFNGILSSSSDSRNTIQFYSKYKPYYEFTNFYRSPVNIDGKVWPTSEHYFQAQKFFGTPYYERIRKLPSARDAFQFSRDPNVSKWERKDWVSVKDSIMFKAISAKFTQHDDLKKLLLKTKDKKLVEHTDRDSYWGDGGDGRGLNKLGKLLMEVRDILAEKEKTLTAERFIKMQSYQPTTSLKRSRSLSDLKSHEKQQDYHTKFDSSSSKYYSTDHTPSYLTKPLIDYHQHLSKPRRRNSIDSSMSTSGLASFVPPKSSHDNSTHTGPNKRPSSHDIWNTGTSSSTLYSHTNNNHSNVGTFYSNRHSQDDQSLTSSSRQPFKSTSVEHYGTPIVNRRILSSPHIPAVTRSIIDNNDINRGTKGCTASSKDYDIITHVQK